MPNSLSKSPTRSEVPLPFRHCIRLEGFSQTGRTSSIDAEWEALSVASTHERTLPTASARPRFETLPGLGPASEPTASAPPVTLAPRVSARSPRLGSALAATLSLSLVVVAVLVWRSDTGIAAAPAPAASVQSNLVVAMSDPSQLPMSHASQPPDTSQPRASSLARGPEASAATSKHDPPKFKPRRHGKPQPRKSVLLATDNPY